MMKLIRLKRLLKVLEWIIMFLSNEKDFKNDLPEILQAMDQPSIDGINVWYASKSSKN